MGLVGMLEVEVIKPEMFPDVVCECSFPQRAEDDDDEQRAGRGAGAVPAA